MITSFDSRWTVPTALSLVREGNTDLDEYRELVEAEGAYGIDRVGPHLYNTYPLGPSLVAVPAVVLLDGLARAGLGPDPDALIRRDPAARGRIERAVASVVVAATTVIVYRVAGAAGGGAASAALVALVFAFGTSAWSTASRGLWQHGPSMLLLAASLDLLLGAGRHPARVRWVGVLLALAYVMRPTNAWSLAILTVHVARQYRAALPAHVAGVVAVLLPLLAHNLAVHGAPVAPYYLGSRSRVTTHLAEGLAGTLLSPNRGLLVFSPVLILALAGMGGRLRRAPPGAVDPWLAAVIVLHWVTTSAFESWWGGHSYGPRLLADMLPYLAYFLAHALAAARTRRGARRLLWGALLGVTLVASVAIHERGATSRHGDLWNAEPVDVDLRPERLWDWRDLQFLRGRRWGPRAGPAPPASP